MQHITFPAVFMRGGTSKGIFFRGGVLPEEPKLRDAILLRALGSPDPYKRQIDGLGGASSSTSKAVIVSRSDRPGIDVDYLFAQVDVERPLIDYTANCGNLSGAVGPFAISEGLVEAIDGTTSVRIWQVNTSRLIVAHVPVRDGEPVEEGAYVIDGVPFPSAEIALDFYDPGGSVTGKLLPTGNAVDELDVPAVGVLRVTLLDAATITVFVRANDVGLVGTELRPQVDGDVALLAKLESIRAAAAVRLGLAANAQEATRRRPGTPKLALVAAPARYRTAGGIDIEAEQVDFVARMISMGTLHHAFPGTGAICAAVAAAIPGTVVNEVACVAPGREHSITFGHTSGTIRIGVTLAERDAIWHAEKARVSRSARRIMQGEVCIPAALIAAPELLPA